MTLCSEIRFNLGIYVLGAIDPAERSKMEAHLGSCPACRDELAALAGLPALLSRVSEAQISQVAAEHQDVHPSSELLEVLLARAAEERRSSKRTHRTGRWGGVAGRWAPLAAAAVVILVVGALLGWLALPDGESGPKAIPTTSFPSPSPERFTATDARTHIWAQLDVTEGSWGTGARVHLEGVPVGTRCRLVAVATGGRRDPMASWMVPGDGYGDFGGSTMMNRDQIKSFEIVTAEGRPLLTFPAS